MYNPAIDYNPPLSNCLDEANNILCLVSFGTSRRNNITTAPPLLFMEWRVSLLTLPAQVACLAYYLVDVVALLASPQCLLTLSSLPYLYH